MISFSLFPWVVWVVVIICSSLFLASGNNRLAHLFFCVVITVIMSYTAYYWHLYTLLDQDLLRKASFNFPSGSIFCSLSPNFLDCWSGCGLHSPNVVEVMDNDSVTRGYNKNHF